MEMIHVLLENFSFAIKFATAIKINEGSKLATMALPIVAVTCNNNKLTR